MADYASQKVAELQDLLKERGLPHTGKKADLIARLQASDSEQTTLPATAAQSESAPSTTKPATATTSKPAPKASASETLAAAGGKGQPANPTAVPNQKQGEDPAADKGATVTGAEGTSKQGGGDAGGEGEGETDTAPKQDFSAHIPTLTLEEEIEKRRRRAERFGTGKKAETTTSNEAAGEKDDAATGAAAATTTTADPVSEAQRLLERQKRFGGVVSGGNVAGVDSLNQALPERQRKRGRQQQGGAGGAEVEGEREGKRRDSRRREGRGGGDADAKKKGKPAGAGAGAAAAAAPAKKISSEQAEKDRLAAEKRKARFATAAASS